MNHSPIHGQGVISAAPIPQGEVLIRMGGYLLPPDVGLDDEVRSLTSLSVAEHVIISDLSTATRDLSDFLNHSCAPNCGFLDALTVVASRAIPKGEELTIDYAYCELEAWVLSESCSCGTPACRGTIRGSDWKLPALAPRFLEYASPFVRRRIRGLAIR